MKKIIVSLIMMFLAAQIVLAADMTLSPSTVTLGTGACENVDVSVSGSITLPANLMEGEKCKEEDELPFICDGTDPSANNLDINLNGGQTNANGDATIEVCNDGLDEGLYHYTICAYNGDVKTCDDASFSATGDVTVPEFTTIGAGLALVGASLFYFKKRKE